MLFARYLDTAAEGFFQLMLGAHYREIIARAYLQPNHDLSYQHTTFAELDGRIVGMVSAYSGWQHRQADKATLKNAAGGWYRRVRLVVTLFAPMMRILDTIAEQDYYLQAIAVDDDLRGQGIGVLLLNAVEKKAVDSDATRLVLDVSQGNERARRLYLRRGFSIDSRWPRRIPVRAVTFYRMTRVIPRQDEGERHRRGGTD